jgi:hypothetical protein
MNGEFEERVLSTASFAPGQVREIMFGAGNFPNGFPLPPTRQREMYTKPLGFYPADPYTVLSNQ